jgi:hypothetical protein
MRAACGTTLFGLALAGALACGPAEPERPAGSAQAPDRAAPAPAGSATLALPSEGDVEVRFGEDGIVALANQAPRRRVLEALARETGLVVVAFVEGGDPDGLVTFESRGEPVEVVLVRALAGVPFSLERGARERFTVVVGKREQAAKAEVRRRPRPSAGEPREREPQPEVDADALAQLESDDPEQRAEGVEWMDVASAAGFAAVVERLANDPDPSVRISAAESLADADVGAVPPLIDALGDADSRVVLAALESLEMLGDASTVAQLAPALEHSDAAVRQRAAEVAEFLE